MTTQPPGFPTPHPPTTLTASRPNTRVSPSGQANATRNLYPFVQNKPNCRRFQPPNADLARKQTQNKPNRRRRPGKPGTGTFRQGCTCPRFPALKSQLSNAKPHPPSLSSSAPNKPNSPDVNLAISVLCVMWYSEDRPTDPGPKQTQSNPIAAGVLIQPLALSGVERGSRTDLPAPTRPETKPLIPRPIWYNSTILLAAQVTQCPMT
jgi:hypothetical protein